MKRGTPGNPFEILLVEDNPADADLVREALEQTRLPTLRVTVIQDGEEAMRYLRREPPYEAAAEPDLLMLDLNLPRKDGREVLAELRLDPRLTHLPVLVLSSSEAERDLVFAYRHHANCFVSKPLGLDQFFEVVHALELFWLSVAKLPPRVSAGVPEAAQPPAPLLP